MAGTRPRDRKNPTLDASSLPRAGVSAMTQCVPRPPLPGVVALLAGAFVLLLAGQSECCGASGALIVAGLSGTSANAEEFGRLSLETKRLLTERGVPAAGIETLGGKVTRAAVLERLQAASKSCAEGDEFWLVLFGHGGRTQGSVPAFQVSGPRLTAPDLKTALDAIPARQFVFVGTSDSGAFLPVLQNARRATLSATKGDGENDQPRFPAAWVAALAENPRASFAAVAARAAGRVEQEYVASALAVSEHARLADPTTGTILEAPFGVNLAAADASRAAAPGAPSPDVAYRGPTVADIPVKIRDPAAQWEQQPATDATRKLVADARSTPNPEGHAALVLEQRLGFTVEEDRTTQRASYYRVFLAREEAVEDWANQFLPQSPPSVTTRLELARVIQPDGSATAFNPARLPAVADPDTGDVRGAGAVFLPNAHAGCVVEISYRTQVLLNAALPHVSETLPVQRETPVLQTSLEVRVPVKGAYRVALNHLPTARAQETTEHGRRVYRWQLGPLAAAEPLPGDPPAAQWVAAVAVSSLPSWDDFAAWFRRIAQGSDQIDDTVRRTAAELGEGARDRTERIRRAFEFVSALRYVAVECGVHGFRPRTPAQVLANRYGDCKDKANLLVALLRAQNIPAQFVLLNRGSATDVSFPSWQFNHAICFVGRAPEAGQPEDLWMDSTDSVTPFGFVPPGDYGRAGLVFDKDRAAFKTVANAKDAVSAVEDKWELTQDAPSGGWQGSFRRAATGLADDGMRRAFRGLTPAQRGARLYTLLADLWPSGDFRGGTVSDVSALREAVELRAEVRTASATDLPRVQPAGLEMFGAPSRDRPLLLNDGQPMALTQTVQLRYAAAPGLADLPPPRTATAGGQKMSVRWERVDERTVRRVARLELAQPTVPPADYASLRGALHAWSEALAH